MNRCPSLRVSFLTLFLGLFLLGAQSEAVENSTSAEKTESATTLRKAAQENVLPKLAEEWKPLFQPKDRSRLWINSKKKEVALLGEICLTKGFLEMFACMKNTKEHESIVALQADAKLVHAALLAIGAKPGKPANWRPSYRPASGDKIDVTVEWVDKGQLRRVPAQQMIRDLKTKKPMAHPWVFGGSGFWTDPDTGKRIYKASQSGELICVSNFPTAMLDIPIESTQENDSLAFEAFTQNIPTRFTPVRVYLSVTEKKKKPPKSEEIPK